MKKFNRDTKVEGLFDIFIKDNVIIKKIKNNRLGEIMIKKLKNKNNFIKYKKIIENSYKNKYYGKYTIKGYNIENDGSYSCDYIEGYRLDKIKDIDNINILVKIKKQIINLQKDFNNNKNYLAGDWALHNLVYCISDDRIYNIDLEGFYSYQKLPDWGSINKINEWINNVVKNIDKILNVNYFTLILWNPTLFQKDDILKDIPNIIEEKEIVVSKTNLHDYIFDIYKLDTRCAHNIVLPPKINRLKKHNDNHLMVKFKLNKETYKNNICKEAVELKNRIRNKYKSKIKNYIKDIIIHVADNYEQGKYIWEKI